METHPYKDLTGLIEQLNLSEQQILNEGYNPGGIWFSDTRTIICGTFPPQREYYNRKGYIHYSSPQNKFWQQIDKIYGTHLYINSSPAKNVHARIDNAIEKIKFLRKYKIGFVDIYTDLNRKVAGSSKDTDLIPDRTIFDNDTILQLLNSGVSQFVFVYSRAYEEFENQLNSKLAKIPTTIWPYKKGGILLEIKMIEILEKAVNLIYYPMHGKNEDIHRLPALKRVIEFDLPKMSTGSR